ncbi:MAG: autotransporter outer membrane beta-barrel domain-containing protein, partial [Desulfovibrionaceae bacterium]|nr:autotransporter outer membrane beta-barrel domain-containing protein [Desulfovibrionaceae bacterium]
YTVFGDNQTLVNKLGFFARNEKGNAYLVGVPNKSIMGVGLHIFGKQNDVTQANDLLASGEGAIGIRIDGSNNTLKIDPEILIAADGLNGTGLLAAYGKNHKIVTQGDIRAKGNLGVAARFDFGHNLVGDYSEYRGSWIRTLKNKNAAITGKDDAKFDLNLDGPLVKQFDVNGNLEGKKAAIYISPNALVSKINILSQASISGDILSDWDINDKLIQYKGDREDLLTDLTFGYKARANGSSSGKPDANFALKLEDDILGPQGLRLKHMGGRLDLLGRVQVYSLQNNAHLALYDNDGDGISAKVTSDFQNKASATLETDFDAKGKQNFLQANSAKLAGTWALRPQKDFYSSGNNIVLSNPVKAKTVSGWFNKISLAFNPSPTLKFLVLDTSADSTTLRVLRTSNSYSKFASNSGASSLGRALSRLGDRAQGDMQNLFTALDFADAGNIRRALNQLSPEAYDAQARASMAQQGEFNVMLVNRLLSYVGASQTSPNSNAFGASSNQSQAIPREDPRNQWTVWINPFGSTSSQGNHNGYSGWHSKGVGLLAGADCHLDSGLTLGFHFGLAGRHTNMDGDLDAESYTHSAFIGGQFSLARDDWDGLYLLGQARIGMEQGVMDRTVSIGDYVRNNESRWTSPAGAFLLGAGKDFSFNFEQGLFKTGPILWFEYAFLHRPEISETDGKATRLNLDATTYQSLQSVLGGHVSYLTSFDNGTSLTLEALAGWKHELLDGTFRTDASFRNYSGHTFTSETDIVGRDALLLQGSLQLKHQSGFFAQVQVGGEALRTASTNLNGGLSFGLEF